MLLGFGNGKSVLERAGTKMRCAKTHSKKLQRFQQTETKSM